MSALEGLRAAIVELRDFAIARDVKGKAAGIYLEGVEMGFRGALAALDDWSDEHPGLVDFTFRCAKCGAVEAPNPAGVSLVDIEASVACANPCCPACSDGRHP